MKSMTKLMVVAMILAAALVVAPAAARSVSINGTNVFIGEENLNFTPVSDFDGTTTLVHYTGEVGKSSIDKTLKTNAAGNITEFTKGIPTGSYYAIGSAYQDLTYVNVVEPELGVDVVLNTSQKDSVNGKSVTKNTPLDFKLTNNVDISGATADIEVRLPGGGVVTQFGGQNGLKNIPVDGTTQYIGAVDLSTATGGTYTVQAKWPKTSDFYGKGFDSTAVTFEVLSKSLTVTSNKDSVVRGNSFTVTITGETLTAYDLYVKSVGNLGADKYPEILAGQNGVIGQLPGASTGAQASVPGANATVNTSASGTRTVQFNTNSNTDDRTFTIRVEEHGNRNSTIYDEVKVKVEKGSVTITSSGTGTYYLGEEVTLSGTCTDNSSTVHLFMTGPNLLSANGVNLLTLNPISGLPAPGVVIDQHNEADVEADDTWSFKWNTGDITKALDSGGYTIYAVSKPVDKSGLSTAQYATASVQLRSGFITATSSGAVVAKGDDLTLNGIAQGDPGNVAVWIFGKNRQIIDSAPVEDDGSFEFELQGAVTSELAAGQYFVVIQHPMMNGVLDIKSDLTGWINGTPSSGFSAVEIGRLQASDAATALITALDSPNVDDTYVKLTFVVDEAQIFIDAIGDKAAGSTFTITGTTNLAVGDTLNIEVTSAAFQPTSKSEASGFGSVAGTTEVKQGDGANTWSFEVDGASFKPDQYIVNVESIETDTTATATFNVVEAVPTTQATPTATGTAVTTPTATETATATPTQSPGFGALLALAGLGAVAFLVLRRD